MLVNVGAFLFCFLLGSVPFGLIAGKLLKNVDIRDFGSGNIGATNVCRTIGAGPAFVVFLLDALKGLAAVLICKYIMHNDVMVVIGALLSVVGHTFSVFLRFKGGKGAATSLGVIFGLNWHIALVALGIWLVIVGITRYISLASMICALSVPLMMFFWKTQHVPVAYLVLAIFASIAIILKHKSNMVRLINGTENKIGEKVNIKKN